MTWHLLHGIVIVMPEFLGLGYLRDNGDCIHVTYLGGDIRSAIGMVPDKVTRIAFERGFRNTRPAREYPIRRIKTLLNTINHGQA